MSQAHELLDSLSDHEIAAYSVDSSTEEHVVIGADRFIMMPEALKRIAVQFDHNIETLTFDCPRYWDGLDMSKMQIYINYLLPNRTKGAYLAENVTVDANDSSIMHFTWTISQNLTKTKGNISFLVCIKKTDADGNTVNHWNSELCQDAYISEGLESVAEVIKLEPDIITQLLTRMDVVEEARDMIVNAGEYAARAQESMEEAQRIEAKLDSRAVKNQKEFDHVKSELTIAVIDDSSTLDKVVPEGVYPYAKVSEIGGLTRKCTNMMPFPYVSGSSKTTNGITFTANPDGSITIEGTNTHTTYVEYPLITSNSKTWRYSSVTVSLYGNPSDDIYVTVGGGGFGFMEVKAGGSAVLTNNGTTNVFSYGLVRVAAGATVSATVYPMFNEGDVALPYEPYFTGLRNAKVTSVKSVGVNVESRIDIPEEVQALEGYGAGVSNARYGTIMNVLDLEKKKFHRWVKTHVYTGDENWTQGHSDGTSWRYYTNAFILAGSSDDRPGVCTHLPMLDNLPQHTDAVGVCIGFENPFVYFALNKEEFPDVASVKAWMAEEYAKGTPVTVTYADAVEEVVDIEHLLADDNRLEVEAGGIITVENEYGYDVPTVVNYGISRRVLRIGEVALLANNWVTEDDHLYSQLVTIDGVTENTQVDLTPSVQQLVIFYEKDLTFVTENDGGIVTVYAIGQKPTSDYTIQVTMTEVYV